MITGEMTTLLQKRPDDLRRGLCALVVLAGLLLATIAKPLRAAEAPPQGETEISLVELARLLHREGPATADFHELQYRRVLKAPLERRGELYYAPPATFEKRVLLPAAETYRIEGETLSMSFPGRASRQLSLRNQPLLGGLLLSFKAVIGGQLDSLGPDFATVLKGTADQWTLELRPTQAEVARYIEVIHVNGRRSEPLRFEVVERSGDRTVTDIEPR